MAFGKSGNSNQFDCSKYQIVISVICMTLNKYNAIE